MRDLIIGAIVLAVVAAGLGLFLGQNSRYKQLEREFSQAEGTWRYLLDSTRVENTRRDAEIDSIQQDRAALVLEADSFRRQLARLARESEAARASRDSVLEGIVDSATRADLLGRFNRLDQEVEVCRLNQENCEEQLATWAAEAERLELKVGDLDDRLFSADSLLEHRPIYRPSVLDRLAKPAALFFLLLSLLLTLIP